MNNVIMAEVETTGAPWIPLATESTIATVTVTTHPDNANNVNFRFNNGGGGIAVPWPAGVSCVLKSVDLSLIEVAGVAGNKVLVVGGTWQ